MAHLNFIFLCLGALGAIKPSLLLAATPKPSATPTPAFEAPILKTFSAAEKARACKLYEGKYIGFYSQIFKVEKCQRRELTDPESITKITGEKIITVDADVLIKLSEGPSIEKARVSNHRSCKSFNGHYVTIGDSDIYWVEKCTRMMFPDWESYLDHQKKGYRSEGAVLELTQTEFESLKEGPPMPSILDKVFKSLVDGKAKIDVLPIDEACKGLEGKYVSFYSRLYRIQSCRKQELDAPTFTLKNPAIKWQELKPEQWLSLPDGKPLPEE